jgi:transcriptional regulator with XRE-family HTH domain
LHLVHTATPSNRLRELRRKHGVSLREIAALIERDQSMIYRYEQGLTTVSDDAKRALARRYGVSVDYLMGWDREVVA